MLLLEYIDFYLINPIPTHPHCRYTDLVMMRVWRRSFFSFALTVVLKLVILVLFLLFFLFLLFLLFLFFLVFLFFLFFSILCVTIFPSLISIFLPCAVGSSAPPLLLSLEEQFNCSIPSFAHKPTSSPPLHPCVSANLLPSPDTMPFAVRGSERFCACTGARESKERQET